MTYRQELKDYVNVQTNLVGVTPNTGNYSTGNPLLETGTAYVLLRSLDYITTEDSDAFILALDSCRSNLGKFLAKNPGTKDLISHDDVIGIMAGAKACGVYTTLTAFTDIVVYAEDHNWVLSTTGEFYWDAWVKPWHKAFYRLSVLEMPWIGGRLLLAGAILLDAYFNKANTSDKRLVWLMTKTVKGQSKIVDFAANIWNSKLKKTFGSMKNVFKVYYGDNHVFTKYCKE